MDRDGDVGFIHDKGERMRSSPPIGMDTNPPSEKVSVIAMSSNGEYPFFGSCWDPLISMSHGGNFGGSFSASPSDHYPAVMENSRVNNSSSQLLQYPISSSNLLGLVPGFQTFGSRNFPEMIGSSGLSEVGLVAYASGPQDYPQMQNEEGVTVKTPTSGNSQGEYPMSEDGRAGALPNEKGWKRVVDSSPPCNHIKNVEGQQYIDHSDEGSGFEETKGDKKQKIEQAPVTNLQRKQSAKQTKVNPKTGVAPEGNYVHMRARRGQATNSHSLAERVRREKISERMKMLQELVPGCNKITGKAVMLDEIINYVQSLQQQVEFLSMKLATVNPEVNIDLEQILSKDLLQLQGENSAILGSSGMHCMQPHPHRMVQGNMPIISNVASQFHHMPQNLWDNDLQSLLQMGFGSSMAVENPGGNGQLKPET